MNNHKLYFVFNKIITNNNTNFSVFFYDSSSGHRPQTVPNLPTKYPTNEDSRTYSGSSNKSGVRCVRCAVLPDIQIEGRLMNPMLPYSCTLTTG